MTSYREKWNHPEPELDPRELKDLTQHRAEHAPEPGPERWEPGGMKNNRALIDDIHARSADLSLDNPRMSLNFMKDHNNDLRTLRMNPGEMDGPREALGRTDPALEARLAQPAQDPSETTALTGQEQRALFDAMKELDPGWSDSFRIMAACNLADVLTNEVRAAAHLLTQEAAGGRSMERHGRTQGRRGPGHPTAHRRSRGGTLKTGPDPVHQGQVRREKDD